MMVKPGITELSRYVDSRYTLVTMAAKRARMVSVEQNTAEVYDQENEKPVTVAVKEIAKGKVGYVRSESIQRAKEWEKEKAQAMSSYAENEMHGTNHEEVIAEEISIESSMQEDGEEMIRIPILGTIE